MQRKLIVAIIALIGLGSLAVLGSSPGFVKSLVETVRNSAIARAFSAPDQPVAAKLPKHAQPPAASGEEPAGDIPDTVLWPMLFKFTKGLDIEAGKPSEFAGTADLYNNYFTRQGKLPARTDAVLKETASKYMDELAPLNEKAQATIEKERAKFKDQQSIRKSAPPANVERLQRQRDEMTLRYRDEFHRAIGDEAFKEFSVFLREEFSKGAKKIQYPDSGDGDSLSPQFFIGFSWIIWDDGLTIPLITGFGGTAVDFFDGFYYDPAAISELYNWTTNGTLHIGGDRGHAWLYPALVIHGIYPTIRTHWYCTYTEHYAVDRFIFLREAKKAAELPGSRPPTGADWLTAPEDYYYLGYTQVCHQVQSQCEGASLDSCQEPTPTPTPSPTPIEIKTVGFTGDHPVIKFATGTAITDPTWTRGDTTNNALNIVAYTKDSTTMKMDASFDMNPPPPGGDSISVKVQAKYNGQVIAGTANNMTVTQSPFTVTNLQIDRTKLEGTALVKKGTYTFNWEVTVDNGQTWRAAGNSSHTIYWTYADPVGPANCGTDGIPRNCTFTAGQGKGGPTGNANEYPGLYDDALKLAIDALPADIQTPDAIAKNLAFKIDNEIIYDPNFLTADTQHPLYIFSVHHRAQCSANANLHQGLLRSIGIDSEVTYFWGGTPTNPTTGGKVHVYHYRDRDLNDKLETFQTLRPKKSSGGESVEKDPHFKFHAVVKLGTNYYDPSYGKDLFAQPTYPFGDIALQEIVYFKDDNPNKPKFKKKLETAPYVVKAVTMETFCVPSATNSNCAAFPGTVWAQNKFCEHSWMLPSIDPWNTTSNFDADAISDIAVWRPSDGVWYVINSADQTVTYYQFGQNGDKPAQGDFDGDGITDFAIYRPAAQGLWYITKSTDSSVSVTQFGLAADRPITGDFDGDGRTDIAVYRPSTGEWYWINSSNGSFQGLTFGLNGDVPVSGDYDGDQKTDFALYRPSNGMWYILNSSNYSVTYVAFGLSDDIPVTGDYDDDGKADVAVFRPSDRIWYISRSTAGFLAFQFGNAGDVPSTGDYNNDGGVDPVVWSPSTGVWSILNLENNSVTYGYWGLPGDVPLPAAFNR